MKKAVVIGLMLQVAGYVQYVSGLQIKATCDNQMQFYVDGTEYSSPNKNDWTKIDTINVPTNGNVFGIKCYNSGGPGAIIMSTSDGRWSNTADWKCTNTLQSGWTTRNFDDSSWSTPVDFGKLGAQIWSVVSGINSNAHWIWTPGGTINSPTDRTVYCRTNIKVHGAWSTWTSWGSCTKTCATGTQQRTRSCSDPTPAYGGDDCPGTSGSPQTQNCNTQACPIHGGWSDYGSWTTCSCSQNTYSGSRSRTRTCTNPTPQHNGNQCSGSGTQTQSCNCPRDGGWSSYGSYGSCSVTCGGGSKTRTRTCTNPSAAYGGADCTGASSETASCNTQACPIHGNWGAWSAVTGSCDCSAQNALGVQSYTRQCNDPAPQNNGNACATNIDDGSKTETDCDCDINGNWATWGQWGSCSATCGDRTKSRSRTCTNPAQANNGADCSGSASESTNCTWVYCPINGNWGAWSAVSGSCDCSAQNALGVQTYTRQCDDPAAQYNGNDCATNIDDGTKTETDCACNINGNWATWGSYGDCSATCGDRVRTRTRTCSNPPQANNGTDCAPPGSESLNCTWVYCPVHGGWSVWQNATNCDCTQDSFDGTRDQSRQCNNPTPEHNGTACSGATTNEIYCNCITEIPGNDVYNYTKNGTCSEAYNVTGTTWSLSNCLFSCYQDSSCVAFVYLQTSDTPCYKMTGCTAADATDGSVLFVKINPPTSTDTTTASSNGTAGSAEAQAQSALPVTAMAAVGSGAALLALLALLILIVLRRRKKKKEEEEAAAAAEASAFQQSNATTGASETNDATVEDFNADSSW